MIRILVGFAGPIGSGKDTMAKAMAKAMSGSVLKFASPMYNMAKQVDPAFDPDMLHSDKMAYVLGKKELGTRRNFLQKLGTEFGRNTIHEGMWLAIQDSIMARTPGPIFYSDTRFENEAQWIRDQGGHIIHLRCNWQAPTTAEALEHPSENQLKFVRGDSIIGLSSGEIVKGAKEVARIVNEVFKLPSVVGS